jgi:hypothetical protein
MKTILYCMILLIVAAVALSCGDKASFEKLEDFEAGNFALTSFGPGGGGGRLVSEHEKTIGGRFSVYEKGDPLKSEWCEFLYSDNKKMPLQAKGTYTVMFKLKAVDTPGPNGFYYFLARSTTGGISNDRAFTKWTDVANTNGGKSIDVTLGNYSDYYLIWGIHGQGALAIDDIMIVKRKE